MSPEQETIIYLTGCRKWGASGSGRVPAVCRWKRFRLPSTGRVSVTAGRPRRSRSSLGTPGGHRSNLLEGGMATRKRAARTRTRSFRVALRRMGAKLEDWQVRPLILGAQASTSLEVGPQHLLRRICGDDPVLGKDLADADANMQSLMEMWNQLVFDHNRDRIRLSKFPRPKHPTKDQLVALATRRDEEVTWFLRGPRRRRPGSQGAWARGRALDARSRARLDLLGLHAGAHRAHR